MMATASIIESFAKNDDIFDAEVDDDSDGEHQQDVNALENTCNKTSDEQQTAQKDEDMDDEVSLQAPESSVSKTKEDEGDGDGELKKDDVQPPSEDKEIENDRTVKDDIFDDEGSTKADDSEDNDSEKENEEEDEESLKQSQKKRDKSPKRRKLKKADVQSIHSESQRMLRDSRIKLPYYTPAVKPITHFLKRIPNCTPQNKKDEFKKSMQSSQELSKGQQVQQDPSTQTIEPTISALTKDVNTTPKLSDANDPFFFDETPTANVPVKGIQRLMHRFAQHTKKPKEAKKTERIVIVDADEENKDFGPSQQPKKADLKPVPGGRLQALKQQLEVKMKKQRAELRKIHESQRKLDNEEVSEEEEAEMTDESSDSDYELDKWNKDDERKQEEENDDDNDDIENDDEMARNKFIDGEADEDDDNMIDYNSGLDGDVSDEANSDDDNENSTQNKTKKHKKLKKHRSKEQLKRLSNESKTIDLFNGDSCSQTASEESQTNMNNEGDKENEQSLRLRLDSLEDDEHNSEAFTKMKTFRTDSPSLQLASDFTNDSSGIEPAQGGGKEKRDTSFHESDSEVSSMLPRIGRQVSNKKISQPKPKKVPGKLSQLTLPIEDSQDLFDEQTMDTELQDKVSVTNGFSFAIDEESQFTQILDTQGFLFSTKKQQKQNPQSTDIPMENSDMEEILGLCSGQFTGAQSKPESNTIKRKPRSLFGTPIDEQTESNMDELLDLCSGMFGSKEDENAPADKSDSIKEDSSKDIDSNDKSLEKDNDGDEHNDDGDDDDDDDDDDSDLGCNDDVDQDDDDDSNIDMDKLRANKKYQHNYGKSNKLFDKKKFYEEEAELSGSDVGSDEDEDIDTDEDVLEEDSDLEELPSDEELQNQISKVHMKSLLDQDKAELRLMQDIYLQDGDLHGDGRKRNFKWRGIDYNSQPDLFHNRMWNDDDDNANMELLTEEESKRRKERFERDNFLREEMQKGATNHSVVDIDENSQSILNIIKDTSNAVPAAVSSPATDKPPPINKKPVIPAPRLQRVPSQKGSFLNRSKATLNRLSSITSNTPNASSSGRSFVFKAVDEKTKAENNAKKMPRTASMVEPAAKRPKFDRSLSDTTSSSIFSKF